MIWHVGDGSTIKIWKDPWLPILNDTRIHTASSNNNLGLTVDNLILQNPKRWNVDLLQTLFEERDINAIQQIPLSMRNISDHIG